MVPKLLWAATPCENPASYRDPTKNIIACYSMKHQSTLINSISIFHELLNNEWLFHCNVKDWENKAYSHTFHDTSIEQNSSWISPRPHEKCFATPTGVATPSLETHELDKWYHADHVWTELLTPVQEMDIFWRRYSSHVVIFYFERLQPEVESRLTQKNTKSH